MDVIIFEILIVNYMVEISAGNHLVYHTNKETIDHKQKFIQISYDKDRYGDTFSPSTIPLWNNLPTLVVEAATVEGFKTALKKLGHDIFIAARLPKHAYQSW